MNPNVHILDFFDLHQIELIHKENIKFYYHIHRYVHSPTGSLPPCSSITLPIKPPTLEFFPQLGALRQGTRESLTFAEHKRCIFLTFWLFRRLSMMPV